eukprot:2033539-Pleurochrysis_carterae.AAC.1
MRNGGASCVPRPSARGRTATGAGRPRSCRRPQSPLPRRGSSRHVPRCRRRPRCRPSPPAGPPPEGRSSAAGRLRPPPRELCPARLCRAPPARARPRRGYTSPPQVRLRARARVEYATVVYLRVGAPSAHYAKVTWPALVSVRASRTRGNSHRLSPLHTS